MKLFRFCKGKIEDEKGRVKLTGAFNPGNLIRYYELLKTKINIPIY